MADYNLGTARGKITVDYDGRGVAEAQRDFQSLDKSQRSMRQGFAQVAAGSAVAGLGIAAGLGLATKVALDFEKQVSAIGAVSGATGDDLEALRAKALDLGSTTAFSASEAALAMEELAKAGVPIEGILNGAADATVALAAAGGVELPKAAEIASNAMNAFRLKASDMPKVADLIAGAANASAISVEEFGLSLQQSGAVANLVGVSFEDLSVAIALMGQQGIKGSDAGTSLKTMLSNLQPTTSKQIALMKELGIVTADGSNAFFDASGNLKSLADVSGILQKATAGMTAAQKMATLETIFGSDAIRAAAILTQAGAEGFNELAGAMQGISAADVAAARLDNTAGSLEQMKGALETAAINLGTIFLPAVRAVADFIGDLANKFSQLDPRWQKLIGYALAAAAAAAIVIAAIAGIGFAAIGVGAAFAALKVVAIVTAIGVAIAAVVAGLVLLYQRSEAFRNVISTAFGAFKTAVTGAVAAFAPFVAFVRDTLIPMLGTGLKAAIDKLNPAFAAMSAFIQERVAPAVDRMRAALVFAMPAIIQIATFVGTVLVNGFKILGAILGFIIPLFLRLAGPIFSLIIAAISNLIRFIPTLVGFFQGLAAVIVAVGRAIVTGFAAAVNLLRPIVAPVFNAIVAVISTAMAIIRAVVTVAMTIIRAVISAAMFVIRPIVTTAFNAIRSVVVTVMNAIRGPVSSAMNFIRSIISTSLNQARAVASAAWSAISAIFSSAVARIRGIVQGVSAIVGMVRNFFNQLRGAAQGGVGSLISFVAGIPGRVVGALGNLGGLLFSKGAELINGFASGIRSAIGNAVSAVSSAVGAVTRFLPGSPAEEGPLSGRGYVLYRGQHLVEDFASGIIKSTDEAVAAAEAMVRSLSGSVPLDMTSSVLGATSATAAPLRATTAAALAPPARSINIDVDVNAPQNMNPNEVGNQVARRLVLALDSGMASSSALAPVGG